jgi:hypothetical protein
MGFGEFSTILKNSQTSFIVVFSKSFANIIFFHIYKALIINAMLIGKILKFSQTSFSNFFINGFAKFF